MSLLMSKSVFSQDVPQSYAQYNFVNYNDNKIHIPGSTKHFDRLYDKMDSVIFLGKGQLKVLHFGGSHIQADIISGKMREHFQTFSPGLNASRGLVFPFSIARTNNPFNYKIKSTKGDWDYCKCTQTLSRDCVLGLTGMSVTTTDSLSNMVVEFSDHYVDYDFNSVKIFHNVDSTSFEIFVEGDSTFTKVINQEVGYTELFFTTPKDSIALEFAKMDSLQTSFTFYGAIFESNNPGIQYNSVGVNGADVPAYLRCTLLEQQVAAIKPDLVIFAIGINDANRKYFSTSTFKNNYGKLIERIQKSSPNTAIIFNTNNDCYYRRRYANKNGVKVQEAMFEMAKEYNAGVWDLFSIMGGLDSVPMWQHHKLAKSDKIHFTRDGYKFLGNLFFGAIMDSYAQHLKDAAN